MFLGAGKGRLCAEVDFQRHTDLLFLMSVKMGQACLCVLMSKEKNGVKIYILSIILLTSRLPKKLVWVGCRTVDMVRGPNLPREYIKDEVE